MNTTINEAIDTLVGSIGAIITTAPPASPPPQKQKATQAMYMGRKRGAYSLINANDMVRFVKVLLIVFCFYYSSVNFYHEISDAYWWFTVSASAHINIHSDRVCQAQPKLAWDWKRAEIRLYSEDIPETCEYYKN